MGDNDVIIIYFIVGFFIAIGTVMPFIDDAFNTGVTTNTNHDALVDSIGDESADESSLTAYESAGSEAQIPFLSSLLSRWYNQATSDLTSPLGILVSVLSMFFWSITNIPVWLEIGLFIPLRILLSIAIARNIWVGGGN